jgi:hypothetical protein
MAVITRLLRGTLDIGCPRMSTDSRPWAGKRISKSRSSRSLTLALALLVFITGTVFLVADLAFGWRLGVVNAMLHRL